MNDLRREKLIKILLEDPKKPMNQAMIEAGYSESYAGSVSQIKKTDSFIEKLDEAIKDDGIVATMKAILNRRALTYTRFPIDTEDSVILDKVEKQGGEFPTIKIVVEKSKVQEGKGKKSKWVDVETELKQVEYYIPDEAAFDRMFDKLAKLKGRYAPEKQQGMIIHAGLNEYLDMIQGGEQQPVLPDIQNAEPITTTNEILPRS